MLEYPIFFFSPSTWIFFNTSSIFWKCVFTLLFWMSNRGDYFWNFYILFVFCGWEVTLMCFTSIKIFLSQILRQVPRAWGDWVSPLLVLSPAPGYYRPSLLKKIAISFPLAIDIRTCFKLLLFAILFRFCILKWNWHFGDKS